MGANFWEAPYLSINDSVGISTAIKNLSTQGVQAFKILATTQDIYYYIDNPWNCYTISPAMEQLENNLAVISYKKIDYILDTARKYNTNNANMKVVMVFNNFMIWSGGISKYIYENCFTEKEREEEKDRIPCPAVNITPDDQKLIEYLKRFYVCPKAQEMLKKLFHNVANHVNQYNNIAYKDDETIMSWEILDSLVPENSTAFLNWAKDIIEYVKSVDKNHLVTLGSTTHQMTADEITGIYRTYHEYCDYVTFTLQPQKWGWTSGESVEKSKKYMKSILDVTKILRKPLILNGYTHIRNGEPCDSDSETTNRNNYFKEILQEVENNAKKRLIVGSFYHGWSDVHKPLEGYKSLGEACVAYFCYSSYCDPLMGDRTDDFQGQYSIYATDATTLSVIKAAAKSISEILSNELTASIWIPYLILGIIFFTVLGIFTCISCKVKARLNKQPARKNSEENKLIENTKCE